MDDIIVRAPDKMVDILQGNLLLAYRDLLIYCNVNQYGVEDPEKIPRDQDPNYVTVKISDEQLQFLDLHERYKIICIQEIGNEMSCLVLEDLENRQIRYLRAYYEETEQGNRTVNRKLNLVQLGVMITKTNMTISPLIKYRSVAKFDHHTKKHYQIGIVVRENGRLEVYADFMLVNEYIHPLYQCVDVDTDFN